MKLLALKITSEFRNLEGLNLRFDSTNDTYVIIGNNGTGKTNILEALSSVFSTLLSHSTDFIFSFVLRFPSTVSPLSPSTESSPLSRMPSRIFA